MHFITFSGQRPSSCPAGLCLGRPARSTRPGGSGSVCTLYVAVATAITAGPASTAASTALSVISYTICHLVRSFGRKKPGDEATTPARNKQATKHDTARGACSNTVIHRAKELLSVYCAKAVLCTACGYRPNSSIGVRSQKENG